MVEVLELNNADRLIATAAIARLSQFAGRLGFVLNSCCC